MKALNRIIVCFMAAILLTTIFPLWTAASPLEAGISSQPIPFGDRPSLVGATQASEKAADEAASARQTVEAEESVPRFADTIDLTRESAKAEYIPFTSIADLIAEIPAGYLGAAGRIGKLSERDIDAIKYVLAAVAGE